MKSGLSESPIWVLLLRSVFSTRPQFGKFSGAPRDLPLPHKNPTRIMGYFKLVENKFVLGHYQMSLSPTFLLAVLWHRTYELTRVLA